MVTPSPTPSPQITVLPPPGGTGAGTTTTTSTTSTGTQNTSKLILWIESFQTPMGYQPADYQTKSYAKAALTAGTLNSVQQSVIQRGYAAYKASGGKKSIESWFATMVDGSSNSVSPFQNIINQYNLGGGSYTTQGDTTTIDNGSSGTNGGSGRALSQQEVEIRNLLAALSANPAAELTGTGLKLQQTLSQFSDAMGLLKGTKEINSYVRNVLENKQTVDDAANDMRKQATILYTNFADRLNADPSLTVRDLVNPYLQVMADVLEIDPNMVKLTDPTIQNAISGTKLRSLGDFYNDMRADPRFATTKTAKREAINFAESLLKGFGFNI